MAYVLRTPEAAFAAVFEAALGGTAGTSHDDTPENVAAHLWDAFVDAQTPAGPGAASTLTVTIDSTGAITSSVVVSADGSLVDSTGDPIRIGVARLAMAGTWEGSVTATGDADGWRLLTAFTARGPASASDHFSFGRLIQYHQDDAGGTAGEEVTTTFTVDASDHGNLLPPTAYIAPSGRSCTVVYSVRCTDPAPPAGLWPIAVEADPDTPERILHKLWYSFRKRRDALTEYPPIGDVAGAGVYFYLRVHFGAIDAEQVQHPTGTDVTGAALASSQSTGTIGLNLADGWYRVMGFQPISGGANVPAKITTTVRGFEQVIPEGEYMIWQEAMLVTGGVGHIGIAFDGGDGEAFAAYITPLDLSAADAALLDYWS